MPTDLSNNMKNTIQYGGIGSCQTIKTLKFSQVIQGCRKKFQTSGANMHHILKLLFDFCLKTNRCYSTYSNNSPVIEL